MNSFLIPPKEQAIIDYLAKHNIHRYDEDKPVYKYVSVETAKLIFGTKTIKFSTPVELNDNDLDMSLFLLNISEEQKMATIHDILVDKYNESPHLFPGDIANPANLRRWSESFDYNRFVDIVLKGYEEQKKHIGIFCVTDEANNRYMWEKYAKNGTGFCIEFKFPTLFNQVFYSFTVSYSESMGAEQLFDDIGVQQDAVIQRWIFTKAAQYFNERELRITSSNVGITPIESCFFTGLYYGHNTSPEDIIELEAILQANGFLFQKASAAVY
jgi:hypothetical protein